MHKDEIQLQKAATLKAARSFVRLKHSIAADAELNEVLPRIETQFDILVQDGVLPDVAMLIDGLMRDEA